MAKQLLSDRACRTARAKKSIYYKNDGDGLRLQVRPNGAKYWMLRYTIAGRESTYQIGSYPKVPLEQARHHTDKARELISRGINPSIDRKVQVARNVERGQATFQAVANEWLEEHRSTWSAHHHERNEGLLRRILFPKLGPLPVHEITEPMLLAVLRTAYDAGIQESARRARLVAQQVFTYAKDTHRATHNPALELRDSSRLRKPIVTNFAALKKSDVGPLLRALDKSAVEPVTRAALLVMLLTGLRDAALRAARWSEFDLTAGVWTVPSERRKVRKSSEGQRAFLLPLPTQAISALTKLAPLTDRGPESFVFASHGKAGFLAENTLRIALHRLGFPVTAHGLRSLITDVLNENGFNADAIERQLDHVDRNKVRASYLRSDFLDYRRTMMQWLADWTDAQEAGRDVPQMPGNVVSLRVANP